MTDEEKRLVANTTTSPYNLQDHSIRTLGRPLLDHGYIITPIRENSKAPLLKNWTSKRLSAEDCEAYGDANGVGIVCGQGAHPVIGIDIDTFDEEINTALADFVEVHFGPCPVRQGKPPKTLLVARTEESNLPKMTSAYYTKPGESRKHRLEILSKGQQFVAHGIHPDTRAPYQWLGWQGPLEAWKVEHLPLLSVEDIKTILTEYHRLMVAKGYEVVSDSQASSPRAPMSDLEALDAMQPLDGYTLDDAKADLECISADDYDQWLKVGMALHHQFGGDMEAFNVFLEWSETSENFASEEQCLAKWESFGQSRASGARVVTMRSVIKLANASRDKARRERETEDAKYKIEAIKLATSVPEVKAILERADINIPELRADLTHHAWAKLIMLTGVDNWRYIDIVKMTPPMKFASYPLTEFGNANRMLDKYYRHLMYVCDRDEWFEWRCTHWSRVSTKTVQRYATEAVKDYSASIDEASNAEEKKFAKASQTEKMVNNMVKLLSHEPSVARMSDELDAGENLFACANAVINLETGEVMPPVAEMNITRFSRVEYDPDAKCPLWEETLNDVFCGDKELVAFFGRVIGYMLLGNPKEDVVIIPYGGGANGKSTVMNIVRELMGEYGLVTSADVFMANKGASSSGGPNEALLRFQGRRFIYAQEMNEDSVLQEGLIKAMTGGEPIVARGLYMRASLQFSPTWVIFMPTNHRPIIKGQDYAIWRRIIPIPFEARFEGKSKDPDRIEKLRKELPGILIWALKNVKAYKKEGLNPPQKVLDAREEYRSEMDVSGEWLEACCEFGEEFRVSTKELYASWQRFSFDRGETGFINSARKLGRMLTSKGFKPVVHANGRPDGPRGFQGIRLKTVDLTGDGFTDVSGQVKSS